MSQFVEHPALDAVLKGFQDYMAAKSVEAKYNVHNAQANMATANQIGHQIMGEKPDMILAIATPTAQACAQALKFGNRLIMLHRGKIISDITGDEKNALSQQYLVARFYDKQKEAVASDRMLLG